MFRFRKELREELGRLWKSKTSDVLFESLRQDHRKLRQEFDALVKELDLKVEHVPSRVAISPAPTGDK